MKISDILKGARIIPVVVIDDVEAAVPLAHTLIDAGIPVIEITLRTPEALPSIRRITKEVPNVSVGAGTIWSRNDLDAAIDAGASFGVSPGSPIRLLSEIADTGMPFIPGGQTATEMAAITAAGFEVAKFFPAEHAGGTAMLRALADVHPGLEYCPTGGIGDHNFKDYLSLPSVRCVGGSWITPRALIAEERWESIDSLCRIALRALQ